MTALAHVTVTRLEAHNGWQATCTHCPGWRVLRPMRHEADTAAARHRASHGATDPADQQELEK